jgi:L-asparaginase
VTSLKELPRVDVILVYQGASGDLIKAAVDSGAKGLVIAGAGAGGTTSAQDQALNYAAEKGVFIVVATRSTMGRITPRRGGPPGANADSAQQRRRQFTVGAEDHMPLKARVLLMLALSKTQDRDEIQRMFSEY